MIKKVVIAGCRNYNNYNEAKKFIDCCLSDISKEYNIVILSGGASGADTIGELYAKEKGLKVERYLADWAKYGKSAGPKRNRQMAIDCDYVICFWDEKSSGTKSMINFANKYGKPIRIKRIST